MGCTSSKLETDTSLHSELLPEQRIQLNATTYLSADDVTYNFTEAKVVKVYDGDTITIAAFFNGGIHKFNVRIYGVDCAEIKGGTEESKAKAVEAKEFVENMILNKIINIDVLNNRSYGGRKIREKYNRLLAICRYKDLDIAEELIKNKLGVPYYGGTK